MVHCPAGWLDVCDSLDCNIGHLKDSSFALFLNPGAVANHAGKTWEPAVGYNYDEAGVGTLDCKRHKNT